MAAIVTPVGLTVNDMVGAHIEYERSRPYLSKPIVETGRVKTIKQYRNTLYMLVKPDNTRLEKWVSEFQFRAYVHTVQATA